MADTASKHRAEFAFAQLENERSLTSLRDELWVARGIADRSRDEIAALQTLVDAHHREHKALCESLSARAFFIGRSSVLMAVQYTKWADVLEQ
uniref:Uncharacterized protein n=1 Tax=Peronospora matthiolae TaxID=2874970 RepID=A0AAV1VAK0_9STRA